MVDEPDESDPQRGKKPKNTTELGFKTQEALKVLCCEIEEVVKAYETKFHSERFVPYSFVQSNQIIIAFSGNIYVTLLLPFETVC